jgi:hypothetical protein
VELQRNEIPASAGHKPDGARETCAIFLEVGQ